VVSYGQGAGIGVQNASGIDTQLFIPYPSGEANRFLVFVACSLPPAASIASLTFNDKPGALRAISGLDNLSVSIWELPGATIPDYLPLLLVLVSAADAVVFVLPLFDFATVGQSDLALGEGDSFAHQVHGAGSRGLVFLNLGFPSQVFDSFAPPQTYIQSLGGYNGSPPRAFHFVTATPGEPGGPTIGGTFSQPTPWAAAFLEVK
jgi:hypothetical protein